ncbi:hypothetical protein AVEN_217380-1 [Araneus ventricosus]|uniref:Uncharacterized protein n=1 Tax=Araneus ventricosus TaxID=182803 RepID=A0A4Y2HWM8_ARAVE|nr:hypothetical protein AVEN_217380-1 [Araneus ventricosus]
MADILLNSVSNLESSGSEAIPLRHHDSTPVQRIHAVRDRKLNYFTSFHGKEFVAFKICFTRNTPSTMLKEEHSHRGITPPYRSIRGELHIPAAENRKFGTCG